MSSLPSTEAITGKAGRAVSRQVKGPKILVLPRTQMIQRLFLVPTSEPTEVPSILRFRLPAETPFLPDQVDWTWRIVGQTLDGRFLARVDLVEKERLQHYLDEAGVDPMVDGVLSEDDFLSLWEHHRRSAPIVPGAAGTEATASPRRETCEARLYHTQDRILAILVHAGRCIRSNVLSVSSADPTASAVRTLMDGLVTGLPRGVQSLSSEQGDSEPRPASEGPALAVSATMAHTDGPDLCLFARVLVQQGLEHLVPPDTSAHVETVESPLTASGHSASGMTQSPASESSSASGTLPVWLTPLPQGGWILALKGIRDRRLASRLKAESRTDLLPKRWRVGSLGRRRTAGLFSFGLFCCAASVLLSVGLGQMERYAQKSRLAIDERRTVLKNDLREVQVAQLLIDRVAASTLPRRTVLSTWDRVVAAVPGGMVLTGLSIADDGSFAVHGAAPDRDAVVRFMESLRSDPSGHFAQVVLGGLEQREARAIFHLVGRVAAQAESSKP
jgi:hypothetical protein